MKFLSLPVPGAAVVCFLIAAGLAGLGVGNSVWAAGPTMEEPLPTRTTMAGLFNLAPTLAGTRTVVQSTGTPGGKPTMTTHWKWEYGGALLDKSYVTEKGNGESSSTHAKRHLRGLEAQLKVFPPAPQGT